MIISRTPFRISFFGGGTDYPVWYKEHGGAVLATSIDKYCYITCRYLPPFFEHQSRIVYSKIECVESNNQIEHPSVKNTLKFMGIRQGIEIHHDGDLPARTGLGSSSSFTVGLLHALHALKRQMPSKIQLAEESIEIERNILNETVGSQDQVTAAYGGFNRITFGRNNGVNVQPVIMNGDRLQSFQDHLMLYFTGFSRFASEIAKAQVQTVNKKTSELKKMHEMVDAGLKILTSDCSLDEFGKLLHEAWCIKQSLTNKISTPAINDIYETARKAGAIGGKLLGAGGGGFMVFFVRPEEQSRVKKALEKLLLVPFRFDDTGSQIVFYRPNERRDDLAWFEVRQERSASVKSKS